MSEENIGKSFEDHLKENGDYSEVTIKAQQRTITTLRADLQRMTKDMKMWYANYKGVEAELNTIVYQLECVTAERDEYERLLSSQSDKTAKALNERDALKEAAQEAISEYDSCGLNTQELHDAVKKLRYALAAVKPDVCECDQDSKGRSWRHDGEKVICTNCHKPIEQKEV
jgi:archaellum component FlaC